MWFRNVVYHLIFNNIIIDEQKKTRLPKVYLSDMMSTIKGDIFAGGGCQIIKKQLNKKEPSRPLNQSTFSISINLSQKYLIGWCGG